MFPPLAVALSLNPDGVLRLALNVPLRNKKEGHEKIHPVAHSTAAETKRPCLNEVEARTDS